MLEPPHGLSIDQILTLSGRLDDAPGYDTPRERYRRFLREHAVTPGIVRALLDQCQHAPGEQHQRAFRDLVVHTGHFLGFDPFFGRYTAADGAPPFDGRWHSRSRLDAVIDARAPPASPASLETLLKSVDALRTSGEVTGRAAGLIVLTTSAGRHRLDEAIAGAAPPFPVGVVLIGSLLAMADAVTAGSITHDHVVRVLESNLPGDVLVDMLERSAVRDKPMDLPASPEEPAGLKTGRSMSDVSTDTSYWIATIGQDHATKPEEFLELVVLRRHVLGIVDSATGRSAASPGDWVCFYVAGRGVVGHARVTALRAGGGGLRDAHRFRQLLQVEEVKLNLGAPVALDSETQLRLRTAGLVTSRQAPTLVRISRESFRTLTAPPALPLSG
jgi:hypothetical protein